MIAHPFHPEYQRGCQLFALHRLADAEASFRRVLAVYPNHSASLHQLASVLNLQKRRAEALDAARAARSAEPEEPLHHVLLSNIFSDLKRFNDAIAAADEAIRLAPELARAHFIRACALFESGSPQEAVCSIRETLRIDPNFDGAADVLVITLAAQRKQAEQISTAKTQLSREPENPHAHFGAGIAELELGNPAQAEVHFLESLRLDPSGTSAKKGVLVALWHRNPLYRALRCLYSRTDHLELWQQWCLFLAIVGVFHALRRSFGNGAQGVFGWAEIAFLVTLAGFCTAEHPTNLVLLPNRLARIVLTPGKIMSSALVTVLLIAGGGAALVGWFGNYEKILLVGTLLVLGSIPTALALTSQASPGTLFSGIVAAIGWCEITSVFVAQEWVSPDHNTRPLAWLLLVPVAVDLCFGFIRGSALRRSARNPR